MHFRVVTVRRATVSRMKTQPLGRFEIECTGMRGKVCWPSPSAQELQKGWGASSEGNIRPQFFGSLERDSVRASESCMSAVSRKYACVCSDADESFEKYGRGSSSSSLSASSGSRRAAIAL